ncbi:MAG: glutamyl-tRNA amidotransferase [Coriobacteriaceae bacterium]|nr:MAG: glutamyl-tRNA amidotransferase [Coriobacteriaceae bacterium]
MTKEELLTEIKNSMKAHDKVRTSILRQVHQAIKQVEIDERRDATEADIAAAVQKLQKVTGQEIDGLKRGGAKSHAKRIAELSKQADILGSLIHVLSGKELEDKIDTLIQQLGATTKRDMGKMMGVLNRETKGSFDKSAAAAYLNKKLS